MGDWKIRSGKKTGKVFIQDGGGTIELLGGGSSQSSLIGVGKTQDWYIRSGNADGTVFVQDKGGPTSFGGAVVVKKDIKIGGHLYLTSNKKAMLMETNARLEAMMAEMKR